MLIDRFFMMCYMSILPLKIWLCTLQVPVISKTSTVFIWTVGWWEQCLYHL